MPRDVSPRLKKSGGASTAMTTEIQPAPSKSEPRPFQFGLRSLLALATIVAVVLSLLRWLHVTFGLDLIGVEILAIVGTVHVVCASWAINDALKRGKSALLVVALLTFLGPFGVLPWLLLRPPIKAASPPIRSRRWRR